MFRSARRRNSCPSIPTDRRTRRTGTRFVRRGGSSAADPPELPTPASTALGRRTASGSISIRPSWAAPRARGCEGASSCRRRSRRARTPTPRIERERDVAQRDPVTVVFAHVLEADQGHDHSMGCGARDARSAPTLIAVMRPAGSGACLPLSTLGRTRCRDPPSFARRESQRHVGRAADAPRLRGDESLVVVHGHDHAEIPSDGRAAGRRCRPGTGLPRGCRARPLDRWRDHALLLIAAQAFAARWGGMNSATPPP
jgi:hypothetical protein